LVLIPAPTSLSFEHISRNLFLRSKALVVSPAFAPGTCCVAISDFLFLQLPPMARMIILSRTRLSCCFLSSRSSGACFKSTVKPVWPSIFLVLGALIFLLRSDERLHSLSGTSAFLQKKNLCYDPPLSKLRNGYPF